MRIAQVAPLFESVPPGLYGGSERVVSWLTEELVQLGHEVTLFASGDSQTSAHLVPVCEKALWRDKDCRETLPHHVRMMELVFRDLSRFDMIHFHSDYIHFPLVRRYGCPSVTTLHGFVHAHDLRELLEEYRDVPLVAISNSQQEPVPNANWLGTVYHGLPETLHPFQSQPGEYFAFLGRTSPDKGLERAVEIARLSGVRLKIAAKIYDEDRNYFEQVIQPLLQKSASFVEFVGEIGGEAKNEFLGHAKALLFPVNWPEPFGLVMIEALACGTPVIAWRCGSVPEVIQDGVTGFIVDSVEEAVRCVPRLANIRREGCRAMFEARFRAKRMAADYVRMYEKVLGRRKEGQRDLEAPELDLVSVMG
ncbi:glycosyltransferase family 4 protein [Granulicella mallensis]|uniref:Glycosyltransferase involved in cell wall biosynthesis n=1 Tax=Granulicella mallensis TaxID=940614 RepID=A0A7W8E8I0_9BACT|nr:glycosyltransferase family 4 protein [Granulicella mallensis]MBB5063438.1 glycosyltransferase involved in cell wall biosynthesis [Granulicella mallensis]